MVKSNDNSSDDCGDGGDTRCCQQLHPNLGGVCSLYSLMRNWLRLDQTNRPTGQDMDHRAGNEQCSDTRDMDVLEPNVCPKRDWGKKKKKKR